MGRSAPREASVLPERYTNTEWSPPARPEEAAALAVASAQDVIAALQPTLGPERAARLDAVAGARLSGVTVVLEDLHDPHNGGAALRSCEAMGVLEVHVVQNRDRFRVSPKVTQGCDKWLQVCEHTSSIDCIQLLRLRGFRVYAAVPGAAQPLEALPPLVPAAFLVGNEHFGLSAEARALCDQEFAIPLYGFSESVNLSVATALIVYTHTTRRRAALGRAGDLDAERLTDLRARYYARDIRGAAAIVRRHINP
jgi:tRNA (guanosine-2'-O-)-methyltransferase